MDPENFLELANQVTKLKMYPYFEMAHCIISCLYMREDLAAGMKVIKNRNYIDTNFAKINLSFYHSSTRQPSVLQEASTRLLDIMYVFNLFRWNFKQLPARRTNIGRF